MKTKLFTLLLAVAASIGTILAWDYEHVQIGDLYYNLDKSGKTAAVVPQGETYEDITSGNNYVGLTSVNIPASVEYNDETYNVTEIGYMAFYHCSTLISATLPEGITGIHAYAFSCTGLTQIIIPASVISIHGSYPFEGCPNLASIVVSNGNAYYDSRNNCNAIIETNTNTLIVGCKNTNIPSSVRTIGQQSFYGASELTSITIPNGVTNVVYRSFDACSSLSSVTFGSTVENIENSAFTLCSNITSIYNYATTPQVINDEVFNMNKSLCTLYVPEESISLYQEANVWKDFGNIVGVESPEQEPIVEKVQIGDLYYNLNPSNHTAEVTSKPNEGTYIGNIVIPSYVEYENNSYSVTGIGSVAFSNCTELTGIEIPNSVTEIGYYACSGSGLVNVTIPASVTSIDHRAFNTCYSLLSINVETDNLHFSSINGVMFNKDQTDLIIYPCGKQGSYTIPDGVTRIGYQAFAHCTGLTEITIPNTVITIEDHVFMNCPGLISVTIPSSVTNFDPTALDGHNLSSINVDTNNPNYCSIDGIMYSKDQTILIRYPNAKQSVFTIPDHVTIIGESAFGSCDNLTSITIPNTVTSIGGSAFSGCTGLPSITIPNSVTSLGGHAFYGCGSLTSVTISSSVTSIGDGTFLNCGNLTSIIVDEDNQFYSSVDGVLFNKSKTVFIQYPLHKESKLYEIPNGVTTIKGFALGYYPVIDTISIPNSVTTIEDGTFYYCHHLKSIINYSVIPQTIASVFWDIDRSIPLYVPARSIGLYKSADQWKEFTNILSIEEEWDPEGPVNPGKYELKLLVNDETMGSVTGEGLYAQGTEVTITAIPAGGCRFVRWSDGNTDVERTIILTVDTTFTAYFEPYYITMNFETATEQIAGRWFAFGVPFDVAVSTGIFIVDTDDPALCNYDFVIDEYDGALRASTQNGWKRVASNDTLRPGRFYMIAPKAAREWRFEATRNSTFNEQNSVTVNAYPSEHGEHHSGWNGIANPFWTSATAELEGVIYATVYNNYYGVYSTELLSEKEWSAAEPFFVQTPNDGEVVFSAENTPSPSGAPMRMELSSDKTIAYTLELADASSSYADKAYITTFEGKENRYKIGRDLEKMQVNNAIVPQLWFEAYGTHLAAYEVPSSNDEFLASIGLFAPQEGTYTLSISNIPDNTDIFLTKNGQEIWNLANAPYSLTLKEGESDEYALHSYKMPTSIEDINNNMNDEYSKLLRNGQILILRGDKTYTLTGQLVK